MSENLEERVARLEAQLAVLAKANEDLAGLLAQSSETVMRMSALMERIAATKEGRKLFGLR